MLLPDDTTTDLWLVGDRVTLTPVPGAVTVTDAEELAGVMTDKLAELFDEDVAWRQFYRAAPGAARAKRRKLN